MVKSALYLLLGKEEFLKQEFIQNLRNSLFPKASGLDLNYQEFHAGTQPLHLLLDFLQTAPFLSDKRLAILREVDELEDEERKTLLLFVERFPTSGVLVVVSNEGSVKKDDFLKQLSEKGTLVACHPPFERDLPRWIENRVKKYGKEVERGALPLLMERAGKDLASLDSALEQLTIYINDRRQILGKDIEALLGKSVEADVFRLVDVLLEKNTKAALEITGALLKEGTRAYEIVAVLAGQFDRMKTAQGLLREGRPEREVGSELRVHSFFLEKFIRQTQKIKGEEMAHIFRKLLECDESIKTSRLEDGLALERLILQL